MPAKLTPKESRARRIARFWSNVDRGDGCWIYRGTRTVYGYGAVSFERHGQVKAHRLSWELHNGPVPGGLCVLHRCDVRACVNPAHLFLGTRADNTRDMFAKGRDCFAKRRKARVSQFPVTAE